MHRIYRHIYCAQSVELFDAVISLVITRCSRLHVWSHVWFVFWVTTFMYRQYSCSTGKLFYLHPTELNCREHQETYFRHSVTICFFELNISWKRTGKISGTIVCMLKTEHHTHPYSQLNMHFYETQKVLWFSERKEELASKMHICPPMMYNDMVWCFVAVRKRNSICQFEENSALVSWCTYHPLLCDATKSDFFAGCFQVIHFNETQTFVLTKLNCGYNYFAVWGTKSDFIFNCY